MASISERESREIEAANASDTTPVVFIHDRGPLLILDGEKDHKVPWAIANAAYKRQKRNRGVTEIKKMPNRGHSLTSTTAGRRSRRPRSTSSSGSSRPSRRPSRERRGQRSLQVVAAGVRFGRCLSYDITTAVRPAIAAH